MAKVTKIKKLTVSFVKSVQATDEGQLFIDDDPKGFGLKVKPTGRKSYFIRCDISPTERGRKLDIGDATVLELDCMDPKNLGARQRARRMLAGIIDGKDPRAAKLAAKEAEAVLTISGVLAKWFAEFVPLKSYSTPSLKLYATFRRTIEAAPFANVQFSDFTRDHWREWHRDYAAERQAERGRKDKDYAKQQANRLVDFLRGVIEYAWNEGWLPKCSNDPQHASFVPKLFANFSGPRGKGRHTVKPRILPYLSMEDNATLFRTLQEFRTDPSINPIYLGLIRVFHLCGVRPDHLCRLAWKPTTETGVNYVDRAHGALRFPWHKTVWRDGKPLRPVPITPEIDEILNDLLAAQTRGCVAGIPRWVFPRAKNSKLRNGQYRFRVNPTERLDPQDGDHVGHTWRKVLDRAKLPYFRFYDLRGVMEDFADDMVGEEQAAKLNDHTVVVSRRHYQGNIEKQSATKGRVISAYAERLRAAGLRDAAD